MCRVLHLLNLKGPRGESHRAGLFLLSGLYFSSLGSVCAGAGSGDAFGSASAVFHSNRRGRTQANDLHSLSFPEKLFWFAGRLLASPFLTSHLSTLASLNRGPRNGAMFSASGKRPLENLPHKMGQQSEEQQHKHAANPDQEVHRRLWRINFLFVHNHTLPRLVSQCMRSA